MTALPDHGTRAERLHKAVATRQKIVSAADIQDLLRHPYFAEACREAIAGTIEDYTTVPLVNRVFGDRGQFFMGMFAQYLHHVPVNGEVDAGLTAARFRTLCAEAGIASPGRATAMLNLMRFAGYLRRAPSTRDRRRVLLEPTNKLIGYRSSRWRHHFEAAAKVVPEATLALRLWDQEWFQTAFLCACVNAYLKGFRFVAYAPELARSVESLSGFTILLQIKLASQRMPEAAEDLSVSGLAASSGTSRAHVRNVLACAASDGLIEARCNSRDPVIARPMLHDTLNRFYASAFALSRHCVRIAAQQHPADKSPLSVRAS